MDDNIKKKYLELIHSKNKIEITVYTLIHKKEELDFIVKAILTKYNRPELISSIYTSIKELILNGVKANIKRLFFEESGFKINNDEDYVEGMKLFKEQLSEKQIQIFEEKIRKRKLFVKVMIWHNKDRIKIKIINNTPLSEKEDKRIREKFKKSSQYNNIGEFYLDTLDNTEGAGLGITLILMMLKAENFDPHLFTIYVDKNSHTVAKLIYPLNENYKFVRKKYGKKFTSLYAKVNKQKISKDNN